MASLGLPNAYHPNVEIKVNTNKAKETIIILLEVISVKSMKTNSHIKFGKQA